MSDKHLSKAQNDICNYNEGSIVVIAGPGSGKTFTVCEKIKTIVDKLPDYQGVIAISYTNKASKELKDRLKNINTKGSFFNTLDTFLLMEIIYPFGEHVFGNVNNEFEIFSVDDKSCEDVNKIRDKDYNNCLDELNDDLGKMYIKGKILLEYLDILAIYIIEQSKACKRYLTARYKYIFIDEYQDCGLGQHKVFLKIISLGIIGVAVGDPDQSIYGFSNKSAKYLLMLKDNDNFKTFYLSENFRSNQAIVDYSLKLLHDDYEIKSDEKRVFYKRITGTQINICKFIDLQIDNIMSKFDVKNYNEVGILVRGDVTGKIVNKYLKKAHQYSATTSLDKDSSIWSGLFKKLLYFKVNNGNSYELAEEFFDIDDNKFKILYEKLQILKNISAKKSKDTFVEIAKLIYPSDENYKAKKLLEDILKDSNLYNSYKEANNNEIQIMTLHKSKGLEFKIVFHLDLYKYIMPIEYNGRMKDFNQELNLHYVGITRAIEACFLITSTKRLNKSNEEKKGIDSCLLAINNLYKLRRLL